MKEATYNVLNNKGRAAIAVLIYKFIKNKIDYEIF